MIAEEVFIKLLEVDASAGGDQVKRLFEADDGDPLGSIASPEVAIALANALGEEPTCREACLWFLRRWRDEFGLDTEGEAQICRLEEIAEAWE
jgi:hypothetical protein